MSRSKHTRPRILIATDRTADPRAPRSAGDARQRRRVARQLKLRGVVPQPSEPRRIRRAILPRIVETRPRPGREHVLNRREIRQALLRLGPECYYGLRCITLGSANDGSRQLKLGRYENPGCITLFAQPPPPWRIDGIVDAGAVAQLERAGASVEVVNAGTVTVVDWPSRAALRDFMLFDVLVHEIGHHLIQHSRRRMRSAAARTSDHEAFADAFARQCRINWTGQAAATGAFGRKRDQETD
ncbi:MAG: hypothetical protein IPG61_08450 [bacterium]|nr:hypothetical protein [bacterium]